MLNESYGTTSNPHYLAFYSSSAMMVAFYCLISASNKLKLFLAVLILLLGSFLLETSSRPTWIGFFLTCIAVLFFLEARLRNLLAILITTVTAGLLLTNLDNFTGRSEELLLNITTEERVVIWHDAWKMQTDSNLPQWLVGHGLNSFESGFKAYSNYHLHNIDFNSPHNFILEILYTSGVIGLFFIFLLFFNTYRYIFFEMKIRTEFKNIYLLLFGLVTANLITVSITVPFFSGYNLNTLAVVIGVMLFLREISRKTA